MKEMLYEVRCLKSNEDMILALAGQFKQLSHEPEKLILLSPHYITKVQIIREQLLCIIEKMPESKVTRDSSASFLENWL